MHPLEDLGLEPRHYFLVTAHRVENVDDPLRLAEILTGLKKLSEHFELPVIFPMHPRTQKMVREFSLSTEGIRVIDPVGYLEFLLLESNSAAHPDRFRGSPGGEWYSLSALRDSS